MNISLNKEAKRCSLCNRKFTRGENHISTLKVRAEDDIRKDFCISCWESTREKTKEELYGIWIKKYFDPHATSPEDKTKVQTILNIIEKLKDSEDKKEIAIAYIATQILKRQKILTSKRKTTSGKMCYTDSTKKIQITIQEPEITFSQLKEASNSFLKMITTKHGGEENV